MASTPTLPESAPATGSWQADLRAAVRDVAELARLLELPPDALAAGADTDFPLLVPRGFVARMRKGDLADPLLRQILPLAAERAVVPGYSADPLGEREIAAHGVLRKYPGRALLIASGACPVHCRYCFRRAFPYQTQLAARSDWAPALESVRAAGDVAEVILSGGDPLSLSNARLAALVTEVATLPGVRALRIHTRFPVMLPRRVDDGLCALLRETALRTVVVVHINHPREIDAEVAAALRLLARHVDLLLNQSVLLAGVNDDVATLVALSERLIDCATLPYYLHLLDPVAGAAHFAVGRERAAALISELRARLPGYLVPRLVREVPGELGKTPMA